VDLSFVQPLSSHIGGGLSLEGRVDNVFDAHYQEMVRFPAPGRMLFVGLPIGNQSKPLHM
jgi:outer membrane cobalamin receptor